MRPKDHAGAKVDNTASFQKLIEVSRKSLPANLSCSEADVGVFRPSNTAMQ
jgi:hypothetical protein